MQIRLTVLGPRGGRAARGCDVLVTAPEGTPLGKVAGALASAAGAGQPGGRSAAAAVVLYAGPERLSPAAVLGAPPLVDGALLSLHAPAEPLGDHGQYGRFGQYGRPPAELARLHVVGGPDAGGVHLLQGGQARIGRSADADVPLDDPDVSRLHCEVAVGADGEVTVADLGSTNGTALAGRPVGPRPVPFPAGALLQIGESTLRLDPPHSPATPCLAPHPDNDGHLRVALRDTAWPPPRPADAAGADAAGGGTGFPAGAGTDLGDAGTRSGTEPGGLPGRGDAGAAGGGRAAAVPGQADRRAGGDGGRDASAPSGPETTAPGQPTPVLGHVPPQPTRAPGVPPDSARTHGAADWRPAAGGHGADASGAGTDTGSGGPGPRRDGADGTDPAGPAVPGTRQDAAGAGADGTSADSRQAAPGTHPAPHPAGHPDARDQAPYPGGEPTTAARPDARGRDADTYPGHDPAASEVYPGGQSAARASGPEAGTHPGDAPASAAYPGGHGTASRGGPSDATAYPGGQDPARASGPEAGTHPGDAPASAAYPGGHGAASRGGGPSDAAAYPGGQDAGTYSGAYPGAEGGAQDGGGRRATGERARPDVGGRGRGVGAIGAWARRRFAGGRGAAQAAGDGDAQAEALRERWPDPAAVLLTALGPGRRLWERGAAHPDALTVRLGTADLPAREGAPRLSAVPYTVDLRAPASAALTLTGPRPRLSGLARAVLAQLCALHSPAVLEVVLISADRARTAESRAEEWSWLNWLPHLRPAHGQDCRLLLAFDREQAEARTAEVVRRLEDGPLGPSWATAPQAAVAAAGAAHRGPYTLLVVDGDPGSAALRETVARVAETGPSAGVHVLCLAEEGDPPVIAHGVVARLSGDVATTLRVEPPGLPAPAAGAVRGAEPGDAAGGEVVLDAVSADWAEHFARALAPLKEADADGTGGRSRRHALPQTVRLLDELDLAVATPAKIGARWAQAPAASPAATAVLGVGGTGRVAVDLAAEGPHALVGGAPGAGKTELLRSFAAALAAAERPERLALILVDGSGQERGEGLAACAELPHVTAHLVASDPVRMREFAQALSGELKRRAQVLGGRDFAAWHAERVVAATLPRQGSAPGSRQGSAPEPSSAHGATGSAHGATGPADGDALPRLVVIVDDFDALVAPALGAPGRPSAGSVVRALEAVAREGERLGVHLVAATGRPERTADTDADERARIRIALRAADTESAALLVHVEDPAGLDDAAPGRGYLRRPGGAVTLFQAGRVSARIPRTATLRPTVVALEWERMGDPPARRQVRELGNGPTDLALLASALQRAADSARSTSP